MQLSHTPLRAVLVAVLLAMAACRQPPEAATDSDSASDSAPAASIPDGTSQKTTEAQTGDPSQALCTALPPETLGQITSASYTTTSSQIDTATLKHCEYRGGTHVVSVMLATGSDARSRFEAASNAPGVQRFETVDDQANWEPVRGMLSVLVGDRSVEVTVNPPHGTAEIRQRMALDIARRASGL